MADVMGGRGGGGCGEAVGMQLLRPPPTSDADSYTSSALTSDAEENPHSAPNV